MSERDTRLSVVLGGRAVAGGLEQVLSELAFEHYPVRVDAGEGEKVFSSFDEAREYLQTVFGGAGN